MLARRARLTGLALLILFSCSQTAFGRKVGSEFRVNTTTKNVQDFPIAAALSNGGFVITWVNTDFGFMGFDEFRTLAQRFTATGNRAGTELAIGPQGDSGGPIALTAFPSNGFVVIFATEDGIRGQRFSNSGAPATGQFVVQSAQSAAALPNSFVVAYSTSPNGVFVQRYTTAGAPIGAVIPVSAGGHGRTEVARLNDGGFVVVWEWPGQDGSGNGIYARRYNANAVPVSGIFRVNAVTTGDQQNPSVTAFSGGFVITWESVGQDGSSGGIYGQRFDASGARLGGVFRANTVTSGNQASPSVAGLTDGGFVVTWASEGQDGSGFGIYGKRYNSAGTAVSKEFRVNTVTAGHQRQPTVTGLTNGDFVITWSSSPLGGHPGIFGQRFSPID